MHQAAEVKAVAFEGRIAHEPVFEGAQKVETADIDGFLPALVDGLLDDLDDAVDDAAARNVDGV